MLRTILPSEKTRRRAGLAGLVVVLWFAGLVGVPGQGVAALPEGASPGEHVRVFVEAHCLGCHDAASKKGGLDLEALPLDFREPRAFDAWVKVHDKLRAGAMPPAREEQPPRAEVLALVRELESGLVAAERARKAGEARADYRRLNRTEYEFTLRDLFDLPGLEVRDLLPDDGRAFGFDKSGRGLDLSHVQLAKYLEAADVALDQAIAASKDRPEVFRERIYPGAQYDFKIVLLNGDAVFLKDGKYDDAVGVPVVVGRTRLMFAMVRLALESDSTRLVTVFINTASIVPDIAGVSHETHSLTHHGNRPETLDELRKIEEAQLRVFAELLAGLRGVGEGDETLLVRTMVLYGSCLGSANAHANTNMPMLLAGGGFRHGQHLAFDKQNNYPFPNLFVSMLQRLGIEADRFASSTGTMRGLDPA